MPFPFFLCFLIYFPFFLPFGGGGGGGRLVISRRGGCNFDDNFFAGRTTQLTKLADMNLLKNWRRDADPVPGLKLGEQAARLGGDIMERVS
jgi:hypothetical protein